ncbi:hypothetical protein PENSPDRAFT_492879 [Peniophora sp. CONT]|nr:hypothetical protein PENSPDRAFT_492879 [Peniophora sp. CONT]
MGVTKRTGADHVRARQQSLGRKKEEANRTTPARDTPAAASPCPAISVAANDVPSPAKASLSLMVASSSTFGVWSVPVTPTMTKQERNMPKKLDARRPLLTSATSPPKAKAQRRLRMERLANPRVHYPRPDSEMPAHRS